MNSSDSENLTNSIDNLKKYALSTHEELKSLHSRSLFKNFNSNQFEMLLEDMKNGMFDESKWGIQKRVEWHMFNILKEESEKQPKANESFGEYCRRRFGKRVDTNTYLSWEYEASMDFLARRTRKIGLQIQPEKFLSLNEYDYGNLKYKTIRNKSNNVQSRPQLRHKFLNEDKNAHVGQKGHLEMVSIPCVNISPLSKDTLPCVNIEPSVTKDQLLRKNEDAFELQKENFTTFWNNLQFIRNVSIDIPPLQKQRQARVNVSPSKSRTRSFPNQGVYEYKHVSSEEDYQTMNSVVPRSDDQKTPLNLNPNASNYAISNSASVKKFDEVDYICKEKTSNKNTNEFDSGRFIERLEERLSSTLSSPPDIKIVLSKPSDRTHTVPVKKDVSLSTEDVSQLKVFSSSKAKTPRSLTRKTSETQTSILAAVDKSVQTSKAPDSRHDNFVPKHQRNNSKSDEQIINDNQGLSQNSSEKFSQSNGTSSKRVTFEIDQRTSPTGLLTWNGEQIFAKISDDAADDLSHEKIGNTVTITNNKVNKSLATETNDIPDIKKSYDDDTNKIDQDSKTISSSSSVIKNPAEPSSHPHENIEQDHSKEFHYDHDEDHSLYSYSFPSGSAEIDDIFNQYESPLINFSVEQKKIFSPSGRKSEGAPESEHTNISTNSYNSEVLSQEETVLPSIEIGDVTISEGEIEFEASISDIQPCNRIAIKFSTKDLGIATDKSSESRDLCDKGTQTSLSRITDDSNLENITGGSSFSEGFILKEESENDVTTKNEESTKSEPSDKTLENVSEGELIGKATPVMEDEEKKALLIENEKLLQRLSGFTGRFNRC